MIFTPSTMHFKTAAKKEPMRGLTVAGTMQLHAVLCAWILLSITFAVSQTAVFYIAALSPW